MSKKTCSSLLCSNQCDKKYRYCYDCAKSKGLISGGFNWFGWIILFLIVMAFFG